MLFFPFVKLCQFVPNAFVCAGCFSSFAFRKNAGVQCPLPLRTKIRERSHASWNIIDPQLKVFFVACLVPIIHYKPMSE
jgi:hypothetical protein